MTDNTTPVEGGPRPRGSGLAGLFRGCLGLVIVLVLLALGGAFWGYQSYQTALGTAAGIDDTLEPFEVTAGQSVRSIAIALEGEGFIKQAWWFRIAAKVQGKDVGISFGTHQLATSMTLQEVIDALQAPGKKQGKELLISPALRLDEVASLLGRYDIAPETFEAIATVTSYDYPFLSSALPYDVPTGATLEGFMYPDTYEIPVDATARDVIVRVLNNFQMKWEEAELEPLLSDSTLSFYDALVLASIVQKEASGYEDMRRVAGVFLNRLAQNMSLGSDVTVLYALKDWRAVLDAEALNIDSPYNTRRFQGLPPGPICSPNMQAIEAVLRPIASDYYYFIADREGIIRYARTYSEHQANIAKYGLAGE